MDRTIRKATENDYTAVMEIRKDEVLVDGGDYLTYEYHKMINCHGAYVLEIHSKIVGFLSYEIVDKSTCYIPQGGRILSSARGQGLFKYLMGEVARKVQEEYPTVKTSRMSTSLTNAYKDRIVKSWVHVCSPLYFHVPLHELKRLHGGIETRSCMKVLKAEELRRICNDETSRQILSASGYMLIDWRFYRFDRTEAENRWKPFENFHCIGSFKKEGNTEEITGLTFTSISYRGSPACTKYLRKLALDIHSTLLREELLVDHVKFSLNMLQKKGVVFDEVRISVPEDCEDLFTSVFPNTYTNGKSLCFEADV